MRSRAAAAVVVVSAVLGGLAGSLVTALALRGEDEPSEPVTVATPPSPPAPARVPARLELATTAEPLPGNGFDPAQIYARRSAGVVTVYAVFPGHAETGGAAQGSGFVVSRQGFILTNAHVITDIAEAESPRSARAASTVYVEFHDGDRVPAKVAGWDPFDDVGVLRVDPRAHALSPVPLGDSSRVVVGEPVAAIGSPFGEQGSLAVGVVSAVGRSIPGATSNYPLVDAIQTDAPINRGNSGGPLFDARGRVIGVNAQIRSSSGDAEGVGFAVPINAAKRSLADVVQRGRVAYAYAGVTANDVTPAVARRLGLRVQRGALIEDVKEGPARRAGLRGGRTSVRVNGREYRAGGDVVVAIDGRAVRSGDDLVRIVSGELRPGDVAVFTVVRDNARLALRVRLDERPLVPAAE